METIKKNNSEKEANPIDDLVYSRIVRIGKNAEENPNNIDFSSFSLGIANEDYSAKTPKLWNRTYKSLNIPFANIRLFGETEKINEIFSAFKSDIRYVGGDVGVGFKDKAPKIVDELDPIAEAMGSINVVVKTENGELKGFNTDGVGYAESLNEVFLSRGGEISGKKIVILGAGGTSNSVAFALAERGARIVILNRTVEKAKNLAEKINKFFNLQDDLQVRFGGEDATSNEVADADAVVNVSIKGASGDFEKYSALASAKLPASDENINANLNEAAEILGHIPSNAIISDVVLGNEATPFLKSAKDAGFITLDGVPMVINQAVEAFWLVHKKDLETKGITKDDVRAIMQKAASGK